MSDGKTPAAHHQQQVTRLVKASVFVGIYLLRILDGIPWLWGNLTVYVTSYFYARGDEASGRRTNWIIAADCICFNAGLLIGGCVIKKCGVLPTVFFSVIIYNAGILLSYFTVKVSLFCLCVTFGVIPGFSGGIIESCQLSLIVKWTEKYQGLSTSSIPSSNILSSALLNVVLTFFVNPTDQATDVLKDKRNLFSEPGLLHRVPYVFLLFGGLSLAFNLTGVLLVRERPGKETFVTETFRRFVKSSSDETKMALQQTSSSTPSTSSSSSSSPSSQNMPLSPSSNASDGLPSHDVSDEGNETANGDETSPVGQDITPKQALRRPEFYALWLFVAVHTYSFFILNTYIKTFGLLYLHDDHFITLVIMLKCICTPFVTWIAGYAVDRYGLKITVVVISSMFSVLSSFFYLTVANKWLFLVCSVGYGCTLFSLFCLTATCCVKIFGKSHCAILFGMVFTSTYVLTIALPILGEWIIAYTGWFALFTSVGFVSIFNLIVLVMVLPEQTLF